MRLSVLWSQIVMVFLAVRFSKQLFCFCYRHCGIDRHHNVNTMATVLLHLCAPFMCLRVFECVSVIAAVAIPKPMRCIWIVLSFRTHEYVSSYSCLVYFCCCCCAKDALSSLHFHFHFTLIHNVLNLNSVVAYVVRTLQSRLLLLLNNKQRLITMEIFQTCFIVIIQLICSLRTLLLRCLCLFCFLLFISKHSLSVSHILLHSPYNPTSLYLTKDIFHFFVFAYKSILSALSSALTFCILFNDFPIWWWQF